MIICWERPNGWIATIDKVSDEQWEFPQFEGWVLRLQQFEIQTCQMWEVSIEMKIDHLPVYLLYAMHDVSAKPILKVWQGCLMGL